MRRPHARFHSSHIFYAFVVGIIIFNILWICRGTPEQEYFRHLQGQTIIITGTVADDPDANESTTSLRLSGLSLGDTDQFFDGSVYVKLSNSPEITRGDKITIKGSLSEGFGPYIGSFYRPKLVQISESTVQNPALVTRDRFSNLIRRHIPSPEVDLALGYLLGARRALPASLIETLRFTGLTHIVVASGYNLSVLVGLSRKLFGRLSRFAALLGSALLIVCFIAITGLSPSMSRAGLVSGLSLIAWYFGRRWHPARILLLAAAITLTVNPYYIVDLGWLLSFASFAGVILVGPLLTKYFYGQTKPNFIAATVLETIAAQLVCLPILIFFFGNIAIISVVPNILVLPTIPYTMLLTFLTGVFSFLPFMASIIGSITQLLLHYQLTIINFFGSLQWSMLEVEPQNVTILIAISLAIIAVCALLKIRTKHSFKPRRLLSFTPIYGIIQPNDTS